jgi:hypothetical protein
VSRIIKNVSPIWEEFEITYNPKYLNNLMKISAKLAIDYLNSLAEGLLVPTNKVFDTQLFIKYVCHYILNRIRNAFSSKIDTNEFEKIYSRKEIVDDDRLKDVEVSPFFYSHIKPKTDLAQFVEPIELFVKYSTKPEYKQLINKELKKSAQKRKRDDDFDIDEEKDFDESDDDEKDENPKFKKNKLKRKRLINDDDEKDEDKLVDIPTLSQFPVVQSVENADLSNILQIKSKEHPQTQKNRETEKFQPGSLENILNSSTSSFSSSSTNFTETSTNNNKLLDSLI